MPDRPGFALLLAERTGLDPTVTHGWACFESDYAHEALHRYNWTNWKKNPDIDTVPTDGTCWPAKDGGCFPGYTTLQLAMAACLLRLSAHRYDAIRLSAGQPIPDQINAIRASDWGTHFISPVNFKADDLKWCWIAWRLGEGWAKEFGPRNRSRRPPFERLLGKSKIPLLWWVFLAAFLAARKLKGA